MRDASSILQCVAAKYPYLCVERGRTKLLPPEAYRAVGEAYIQRNPSSQGEVVLAALELASRLAQSKPDAAVVSEVVVRLAEVYVRLEKPFSFGESSANLSILPEGLYPEGHDYTRVASIIQLGTPLYAPTFTAIAEIAEATERDLTRAIVDLYTHTGGILGYSSSEIKNYIAHAIENAARLTVPALENLARCALKLGLLDEADRLVVALIEKEEAAAKAVKSSKRKK